MILAFARNMPMKLLKSHETCMGKKKRNREAGERKKQTSVEQKKWVRQLSVVFLPTLVTLRKYLTFN